MIGLTLGAYYYKPSLSRQISDTEIKGEIDAIHVEFPAYGYRRIYNALLRGGKRINSKRLRRIMKDYGLFPIRPRAFIRTTDSDHPWRCYPNLLAGILAISGPNQVWVADITYVRILTGFVYLAAILDLYSRKVVGWSISRQIDRRLTLGALQEALRKRKPLAGCLHHSDRGVQYACDDYVKLLEDNKLQPSMSRSGNPYDNAAAESFMKTLKYEEVYLGGYETYEDVLNRLPYFIEELYNKKRLHSSLGYMPPDEFERQFEGA